MPLTPSILPVPPHQSLASSPNRPRIKNTKHKNSPSPKSPNRSPHRQHTPNLPRKPPSRLTKHPLRSKHRMLSCCDLEGSERCAGEKAGSHRLRPFCVFSFLVSRFEVLWLCEGGVECVLLLLLLFWLFGLGGRAWSELSCAGADACAFVSRADNSCGD